MLTPQAVAADRWTERRRRAAELTARWPFASEVLTFYTALLDAQARIWEAVQAELSDPLETAAYVAGRALPLIREVTIAGGPEPLAGAAAGGADRGRDQWEERVHAWLAGGELSAMDRYFVRAAAGPVLEALGPRARDACAGPDDPRHCPQCGGLPQLSVFTPSGEDLVAPRRVVECARCAWRWPYPRMTCPACGEAETRHLPIFGEEGTTAGEATGQVIRRGGVIPGEPGAGAPRFPHVSIQACRTCARYLLNIDLSRDGRAVPVVDEMAAIPLDLYAREQGLAKIVPNLMGL